MARRASNLGDLIGRLRGRGFLHGRIDLANHPHHRACDVLRRLGITGHIVHRIARAVEDVTVGAGDAERGGEILHRLKQLWPGDVLGEDLEILWRRLRSPATAGDDLARRPAAPARMPRSTRPARGCRSRLP
jgi:hypothetical protein